MKTEYYVARMKDIEELQQPGFLVRSIEPMYRDEVNGMWHSSGPMHYDCKDLEDVPELNNLRWEDEPVQISVNIRLKNV